MPRCSLTPPPLSITLFRYPPNRAPSMVVGSITKIRSYGKKGGEVTTKAKASDSSAFYLSAEVAYQGSVYQHGALELSQLCWSEPRHRHLQTSSCCPSTGPLQTLSYKLSSGLMCAHDVFCHFPIGFFSTKHYEKMIIAQRAGKAAGIGCYVRAVMHQTHAPTMHAWMLTVANLLITRRLPCVRGWHPSYPVDDGSIDVWVAPEDVDQEVGNGAAQHC